MLQSIDGQLKTLAVGKVCFWHVVSVVRVDDSLRGRNCIVALFQHKIAAFYISGQAVSGALSLINDPVHGRADVER